MLDEFSNEVLKTRGGNEIKLKDGGKKCVVYIGSAPEVVKNFKGAGAMDQEVPHMAFIGKKIHLVKGPGRYILADIAGGKLRIKYNHGSPPVARTIGLQCSSLSDQFPVHIIHYDTVKQFIAKELSGHGYRYFVLDTDSQRIDMVALKAKNPDARIVILKPPEELVGPARTSKDIAAEKTRAIDLAGQGKADSKNPVFMARIFLRKLELQKVRDLIVHSRMTAEEIGFVHTFISLMVANQANKSELKAAKNELVLLEQLFKIGGIVVAGDRQAFEGCIAAGPLPEMVGQELCELASRKRQSAEDKLEELLFWEWQCKLKKVFS